MATQRGYYRAELERSIDNIEMALTHLYRVMEAYQAAHPEISEQVGMMGNALVEIATAIKTLHDSI